MKAYQADIAKFDATETQVFGVSVDSPYANREFAKQIGVTFPLLSDIKHSMVKDYGVFNEDGGYGNRATFVIDKDGIIQHIDEGNVAIDPTGAEDTCNILSHKKTTPLRRGPRAYPARRHWRWRGRSSPRSRPGPGRSPAGWARCRARHS